jgi:thiazole synthase ThiGH ThiG subunit
MERDKLKLEDRYARQMEKKNKDTVQNEREHRNVPLIVKDGMPGGTFVVTVMEIGAEGVVFLVAVRPLFFLLLLLL